MSVYTHLLMANVCNITVAIIVALLAISSMVAGIVIVTTVASLAVASVVAGTLMTDIVAGKESVNICMVSHGQYNCRYGSCGHFQYGSR